MAIIDVVSPEVIRQMMHIVEHLARSTDELYSNIRVTLMVIRESLVEDLLIAIKGFSSEIRLTLVPFRILVDDLITYVEDLAHATDTLSSDIGTTLPSLTLFVENLMIAVEHLTQKTNTLSSDVGATLASIALLVENLVATTNALALDMHYLLQGCIALVALLCLLTVLCIVRWCYIFSRELRGVQHLKTA
ncbi:uncharacterized protein HD556DRAFT_1440319 [Suillus plorans]|uniref:Uncharacterized protein n=1 Tax=Suillus plorans TaxID=116603 RepID=A0A9P7J0R3_9AGAM|nr:uncharacterized protein HD556DRAFT_1440319 [Suillus plorans]KAG1798619.1 hypothetical protein HD556DRAFT_1440319 [Suillus plorans]